MIVNYCQTHQNLWEDKREERGGGEGERKGERVCAHVGFEVFLRVLM